MRVYDLVLVIKSSLTEEKRKKLLETITSWLKETKVEKTEDKGQKPLSYAIKKELSGHYVLLTLQTDASIPLDFERRVLAQAEVLRHLVLRKK